MARCTVSIIIPVYQVSAYIERCIRSVMNQTYVDIECIIVNDATKDDSIVKCRNLISNYEGPIYFQIIQHDYNRGLSAARNTGTIAATGDYIYYLDSDDEVTPECIDRLVTVALKYPKTEMVIGNANRIKNDSDANLILNESLPLHMQSNEMIERHYFQSLIPVVAWNKLIKRFFIVDHTLFFKEGIIHEDYLWSFYVLKYLKEVAIIKDVTYNYYFRSGSISTDTDEYTVGNSWAIIYDDILNHLTRDSEGKELSYYVGSFCSYYLKYKSLLPAYKKVYGLYREQVIHYCCWYAFFLIVLTYLLGYFAHSYNYFMSLSSMRRKMKCLVCKFVLV